MLLTDWQGPKTPLTFDELHHDDTTPKGRPSADTLILGEKGDQHYADLGEELDKQPIVSAGIRRS